MLGYLSRSLELGDSSFRCNFLIATSEGQFEIDVADDLLHVANDSEYIKNESKEWKQATINQKVKEINRIVRGLLFGKNLEDLAKGHDYPDITD